MWTWTAPAPENETRYSPAKIISTTTEVIEGDPNPEYISMSYVERQNLTMRMHAPLHASDERLLKRAQKPRRIRRFVRVHQTLRVTLAMQAGISSHVWSIEELLLDAAEKKAA